MPRKKRSDLKYAKMNQELLEEFEKLNHKSRLKKIASRKDVHYV